MEPLRLGLVDCDTSHAVEFVKRLHHQDVPSDQFVDGGRVVLAYKGTSTICSQEKLDAYANELAEKRGVKFVGHPREMLGHIDAVLIEGVCGAPHLGWARLFIEAGVPTFVDKPLALNVSDAKAIFELARKYNVPCFSSSPMRFAPEVVEFQSRHAETGPVLIGEAISPALLAANNPGLFHYGIHAVETLYAIMGRGCESVHCVTSEAGDIAVGRWKNGRVGIVRGTRGAGRGFGFVASCEKRLVMTTVNEANIYRELLKRVIAMFRTGQPPVPAEESIEIVAFIEAALASSQQDGAEVKLAV